MPKHIRFDEEGNIDVKRSRMDESVAQPEVRHKYSRRRSAMAYRRRLYGFRRRYRGGYRRSYVPYVTRRGYRAMRAYSRLRRRYPPRKYGRAYFLRGSEPSLAFFGATAATANEQQLANRKATGFRGRGLYGGQGKFTWRDFTNGLKDVGGMINSGVRGIGRLLGPNIRNALERKAVGAIDSMPTGIIIYLLTRECLNVVLQALVCMVVKVIIRTMH